MKDRAKSSCCTAVDLLRHCMRAACISMRADERNTASTFCLCPLEDHNTSCRKASGRQSTDEGDARQIPRCPVQEEAEALFTLGLLGETTAYCKYGIRSC